LLQDTNSKEYLCGSSSERRASEIQQARDFKNAAEAVAVVVKNRLLHVRIVMDLSIEFGHERWNTTLEVNCVPLQTTDDEVDYNRANHRAAPQSIFVERRGDPSRARVT